MWSVFVVFLAIGGLLALFVTVDSIRRARAGEAQRLRPYLALQAIYLATLLLAQVTPVFRVAVGATASLMTPFAIGAGVAYLLRIVFPRALPVAEAGGSEQSQGAGDDAMEPGA